MSDNHKKIIQKESGPKPNNNNNHNNSHNNADQFIVVGGLFMGFVNNKKTLEYYQIYPLRADG